MPHRAMGAARPGRPRRSCAARGFCREIRPALDVPVLRGGIGSAVHAVLALRRLPQRLAGAGYTSAEVGSMMACTCEMRVAGKPPQRACSLMSSGDGALYTQ